jgi:hypothetical protein
MGGRRRTPARLVGGLVVTLLVTRPLTTDVLVDGAFEGGIWLLFATVGLVMTLRRPENPIGWLYAAAGLVWTVYVPWDPWVDQLLRDGRPLPPAVRLAAVVAGTTMNVAGWWLSPGPMTQTLRPVTKPFALDGWAGSAATMVTWAGFGTTFAAIPAAALCVVLRFRPSSGVERQQLRWVVTGAATGLLTCGDRAHLSSL